MLNMIWGRPKLYELQDCNVGKGRFPSWYLYTKLDAFCADAIPCSNSIQMVSSVDSSKGKKFTLHSGKASAAGRLSIAGQTGTLNKKH